MKQLSNKYFNAYNIKEISAVDAFSCFMLVPYGIKYFKEDNNLKIEIEDVEANVVGRKKLMANTVMLIKIV